LRITKSFTKPIGSRKSDGLLILVPTQLLTLPSLASRPRMVRDIRDGCGSYTGRLRSNGYDLQLFDPVQNHGKES